MVVTVTTAPCSHWTPWSCSQHSCFVFGRSWLKLWSRKRPSFVTCIVVFLNLPRQMAGWAKCLELGHHRFFTYPFKCGLTYHHSFERYTFWAADSFFNCTLNNLYNANFKAVLCKFFYLRANVLNFKFCWPCVSIHPCNENQLRIMVYQVGLRYTKQMYFIEANIFEYLGQQTQK
jgi:hypothetical protein